MPRRPQWVGQVDAAKIAAGLIEPDRGERFVQPGATIRYLPQEPDLFGHATTLAYVEAGLGPHDDPHQARYLLQQLGLTGEEDPAKLSGGEARRAALAHVLAPEPDILLLDEPTNHLDLPTIEWLESALAAQRAALVLISHDRRFLENLSRTTVWLDRGRARRVELGFGAFEAWRDEQLAEEEVAQHKLDRKIVAEEHWVRYGVTGRRKRNVRRMAELQKLRQSRREHRKAAGKAVIDAAQAEKSGALVIEAKGIGKAFGDAQDRRGFFLPRHARRPHRHRRPQRQRQDDARQPSHRCACSPTAATCASAPISRWRRSSRAAIASIPTGRCARR